MNSKTKATMMLVGVLAATTPAYAKNGADDLSGTNSTAGSFGTAGDTSGTDGTSGNDDFYSPGSHSRDLSQDSSGARGSIEHILRPGRKREDVKVEVKLKLGEQLSRKAARKAVVVAKFPDDTRCELDFKSFDKRRASYQLHLRSKNGVFRELDGDCDKAALPSLSGGAVNVFHDVDDNPSTDDTLLLHHEF